MPRLAELETAMAVTCPIVDGRDPDGAMVDLFTFGQWLGIAHLLVHFDGTSFAALRVPPVETDGAFYYELVPGRDIDLVVVKGEMPPVLRFTRERFDAFQAQGIGRSIVVAVERTYYWADGIGAVVDPSGAVAFEGECVEDYNETFIDFRASHPEYTDALSTLERLFVPGSEERTAFASWAEPPGPTPWIDQDPDVRVIDPEETPSEIYQQLVAVEIQYVIDPEWRAYAPATICTHLPGVGWNDCIELLASTEAETLPIWQLAAPGSSLHVWILGQSAKTDQPVKYLGEIPPEEWEAAAASTTVLRFEGS